MAWFIDLKILTQGFYLTLFQLFGIGIRLKKESFMITCGIYRFNIYLTFAIEE